ncbi:MAG TPA: gluconate 2-dehydrogenase subunit 3 family protein [Vicinamibacterales bacterium]|jgi:gluconate 2-dehydrogenase subunit 3-like protein|nr:gluconate 2-dehydrogenase subunit 3 family protein [Vicinamibacterales bacterium]
MSEITRRDVLRRLGATLMATGVLDRVSAQEVHHLAIAQAGIGGSYAPKALSDHEYKTLVRLTDVIIPVENGKPGAVAAGAAAWIDMLATENSQLKDIYTKGLGWIDAEMKRRGSSDFVGATPEQQTALLDVIAYRRNSTPALDPGIEFFVWVRRMTVDAFYTSEIGIADIDYRGNRPQAAYVEPTEAIAYALRRSGL